MARKPILQRIALEGGKAIEADLKNLGTAGEKAFDQIRNAALKADLAKFGASLKTFGNDLATVGRRVALAFAGISAVTVGATAAVIGLAKAGSEAADSAGKAAEKTGLQIDAYGRLSFAAKQADVDQDAFVAGMSKLNKAIATSAAASTKASKKIGAAGEDLGRTLSDGVSQTVSSYDAIGVTVTRLGLGIDDTSKKTEASGDVFRTLGVKLKDAGGKLRSTESILGDIAEAFSKMADGPQKAALAIELFGKSGANLLPFLNEGREGLRELGKEAERLGVVFTPAQAKLGDALGDTLDEISATIKGVRDQLGLLFAPIVLAGAETFRDILVSSKDAILALGRAAATELTGIILDLIAALSGRDADVQRPWILEWRDGVVEFGRDLNTVVGSVILPLFRAIRDGAQLVADGINKVFGTNVSGGELLITVALLKLLGIFSLFTSTVGVVISGLRLLGAVLAAIFSEGLIAAATGFFSAIISGATAFLGLVAGLISWPALLVAALVAAGVAVVVFWDDIVAGAQFAITKIQEFFSPENLAKVFEGLLAGAKVAGELFVQAWELQIQALAAVFKGAAVIVTGFVEGVISEVGRLAGELTPTWEAIGTAAGSIWDGISARAQTAFTAIVDQATQLAELLAPAWLTITTAGAAVWTAVTTAAQTAFNGIVTIAGTAVSAIVQTVGGLAGSVIEAFTGATSGIAEAAAAIGESIQSAIAAAGDVGGAEELATALVAPFQNARDQIEQIIAGIRNLVQTGFGSLAANINQIAAQIQASINRILAALRQAAQQAASLRAQAASGGETRFAGGGHVRGPGSATSDSIPAWLSDGEFVMRTRAVQHYGPGLMAALNSLRLPKDLFKGFSLGGMLDGLGASMASVMPQPMRLAGGGMVGLAPASSSGRPVHVSFDGETFEMVAADDVAEKLVRSAQSRSRRSAGKKPGWFG